MIQIKANPELHEKWIETLERLEAFSNTLTQDLSVAPGDLTRWEGLLGNALYDLSHLADDTVEYFNSFSLDDEDNGEGIQDPS